MTARIAAIQMNSGADLSANLDAAARLLEQAAAAGASLAVLPENFAFMGAREQDKLVHAEPEGRGPIQEFLAASAQRLRLWLLGGTVPLIANDPAKVFAASLLFDAEGSLRARYDKVHLFDVDLPNGERYRESNTIAAGAAPSLIRTDLGCIGLSVCYDLRFPEMYRQLVGLGAEILTVPSAFTEKTGQAHWETLLRARAIENQCMVIAPNQSGTHPGGRRTWGHSMIVDSWGTVLACQPEGEGVVLAELDRKRQTQIRTSMPCLEHRRL